MKELNDIQKKQMAQIEKMSFIGHKEIFVKKKPRQTRICTCKGKNGQIKDLYYSEKEAWDLVFHKSSEIGLSVYPCPSGLGWHLTRNVLG
jgi:hypothetical protein